MGEMVLIQSGPYNCQQQVRSASTVEGGMGLTSVRDSVGLGDNPYDYDLQVSLKMTRKTVNAGHVTMTTRFTIKRGDPMTGASSKDISYPLLRQMSGVYLEPILGAQERQRASAKSYRLVFTLMIVPPKYFYRSERNSFLP
jgi:hypothetical protein